METNLNESSELQATQEVLTLLKDWRWRLDNLYFIKDEAGKKVKFKLRPVQKWLIDHLWFLNIILKARQLGFCLDPSTRVLTADLKWVPIGELQSGREIVAVDEMPPGGRGQARRMRTATVLANVQVKRVAYKITFDDGRYVICTDQHPWLSRNCSSESKWRSISGKGNNVVGKLRPEVSVRWITKPWEEPKIEDGWFGGMLDGEGSISKFNSSAGINVSQREGMVWDRLVSYAKDRGYNARVEGDKSERLNKFGKFPVPKLCFGRMDEIFRLIGQTRPTRFLGNNFWEGRELPGKRNGDTGWSKITSIEKLDERVMIDLQTSTGTYIAEGFVSHNTTAVCIMFLDAILFESNKSAVIIAHTKLDADKIFDNKIKFAYDHLPDWLKSGLKVDTDTKGTLKFDHGSSIEVTTSTRSGTVQYLLVTELGPMAVKYPERAKEVVEGSLNTVHKGQMVIIESTAKGREGEFWRLCHLAMNLKNLGAKLTELDYRFFFYPWFMNPEYVLDANVVISKEMEEYFNKVELEAKDLDGNPVKITEPQRKWYVKKMETQGDAMRSEFPSTPEEAFESSVEGAYYSQQMAKVRKDGRIKPVPHSPDIRVDTWWDIGIDDYTSIIFTQTFRGEIRVIDFYENSGEALSHYAKILQDKKYLYGNHYGPHDLKNRNLQTGKSTYEVAATLGLNFIIVQKLSFQDGINATREIFHRLWFDSKLSNPDPLRPGLIEHLDSYKKKWDDNIGQFKADPVHDQHSHAADALRMLGVGWQENYLAMTDKEKDLYNIVEPREQAMPVQNGPYRLPV